MYWLQVKQENNLYSIVTRRSQGLISIPLASQGPRKQLHLLPHGSSLSSASIPQNSVCGERNGRPMVNEEFCIPSFLWLTSAQCYLGPNSFLRCSFWWSLISHANNLPIIKAAILDHCVVLPFASQIGQASTLLLQEAGLTVITNGKGTFMHCAHTSS